jgi:ribosomal subunit interface protein
MEVPPKISFRDIAPSEAIESRVLERIAKLEQMYGRVIRCDVAVEAPHRRHRQGKVFRVRVHLTVPGAEIVAGRDPAEHHAHEDVYVALRDAFDAVERRLEDRARRIRGDVKSHEPQPTGRVVKLFPDAGYGFLVTPDGREIYFHRNAVQNGGFDRLEIGSTVRFAEELGENGPQATTVAAA